MSYITRYLKIEGRLSTERTPEPDKETAWVYTRGKARLSSPRIEFDLLTIRLSSLL